MRNCVARVVRPSTRFCAAAAHVRSFASVWSRPRFNNHNKAPWRFTAIGAIATVGVGTWAYRHWAVPRAPPQIESKESSVVSDKFTIERISDEIFDAQDPLCIVWAADRVQLAEAQDTIRDFEAEVNALPLPQRVRFYYNFRQSGEGPLSVACIKGQRRLYRDFPTSAEEARLAKVALTAFYQDTSQEATAVGPPKNDEVSFRTFYKEVVEGSSGQEPVILQVTELGCFLCFLMRPFINSIKQVFREHDVKATIKTYRLDCNDFPPLVPVTRSTPVFVEYRGSASVANGPPRPWDAYRPRHLIDRLVESLMLSPQVTAALTTQEELLQRRFRRFGLLSMWTQQHALLQALVEGRPLPSAERSGGESESERDREYHKMVEELMQEDEKLSDNLEDNIQRLEKQLRAVVADCISYANMLGKEELAKHPGYFLLTEAALDGGSVEEIVAKVAAEKEINPQGQ